MGLQKYRADRAGEKQKNGGIPFYVNWMGGPTLSLVRNCACENAAITPRTVYVRGEEDTSFSIPAACEVRLNGKRKTITGYIKCDANGEYVFRVHSVCLVKLGLKDEYHEPRFFYHR